MASLNYSNILLRGVESNYVEEMEKISNVLDDLVLEPFGTVVRLPTGFLLDATSKEVKGLYYYLDPEFHFNISNYLTIFCLQNLFELNNKITLPIFKFILVNKNESKKFNIYSISDTDILNEFTKLIEYVFISKENYDMKKLWSRSFKLRHPKYSDEDIEFEFMKIIRQNVNNSEKDLESDLVINAYIRKIENIELVEQWIGNPLPFKMYSRLANIKLNLEYNVPYLSSSILALIPSDYYNYRKCEDN